MSNILAANDCRFGLSDIARMTSVGSQSAITALSPITDAIGTLPASLIARSGSVFYSGQSAFSRPRSLYIIGLNPGGSPIAQANETIAKDIADWRSADRSEWSAYIDASWAGRPCGTHGIQPQLRHMFDGLGLDLRSIPSSNVVFVRTQTEAGLAGEKDELLQLCWPVHKAVMAALGVRVVLALGTTAGRWVRGITGASIPIASFKERNRRQWVSEAHASPDGQAVITVTHPGRANWKNSDADPAPMVRDVLAQFAQGSVDAGQSGP